MSHCQKSHEETSDEYQDCHQETVKMPPKETEYTAEDVSKIMAGLTIALVIVSIIIITFLMKSFTEN